MNKLAVKIQNYKIKLLFTIHYLLFQSLFLSFQPFLLLNNPCPLFYIIFKNFYLLA